MRSAANLQKLDALSRRTVSRETLVRYTFNLPEVNNLIDGKLLKFAGHSLNAATPLDCAGF